MASILSQANRDIDRAQTHLTNAFDRVKWIPEEYKDDEGVKEAMEAVMLGTAEISNLLDRIRTAINGGDPDADMETKDGESS